MGNRCPHRDVDVTGPAYRYGMDHESSLDVSSADQQRANELTGNDAQAESAGAHDDDRRSRIWASTMSGHGSTIRHAHREGSLPITVATTSMRSEREAVEHESLSFGATRSAGAGNRAIEEAPCVQRTCFERDRDRILHSTAFRRLSGKTQVFVFPDDHQRTRLTHALEVAQVATAVARALRLNVALTEAIALGHDCGHGPGGHASEDALSPFIPEGYDHAVWGADVVLLPLNLCAETLDGIRNHSWSRPRPSTAEGLVVSWADRIAYTAHDFEDAVSAGIVSAEMLPDEVSERCGRRRGHQLDAFITDMVAVGAESGEIGMSADMADALAAFRRFNYENIYLRPASVSQADAVIAILRALVEYYIDRPNLTTQADDPQPTHALAGTDAAVRAAVTYVGGMTDRFACQQALALLGWDPRKLPQGVDTEGFGGRRG